MGMSRTPMNMGGNVIGAMPPRMSGMGVMGGAGMPDMRDEPGSRSVVSLNQFNTLLTSRMMLISITLQRSGRSHVMMHTFTVYPGKVRKIALIPTGLSSASETNIGIMTMAAQDEDAAMWGVSDDATGEEDTDEEPGSSDSEENSSDTASTSSASSTSSTASTSSRSRERGRRGRDRGKRYRRRRGRRRSRDKRHHRSSSSRSDSRLRSESPQSSHRSMSSSEREELRGVFSDEALEFDKKKKGKRDRDRDLEKKPKSSLKSSLRKRR